MLLNKAHRILRRWRTSLTSKRMRAEWMENGLAVKGKNLACFGDPNFQRAWDFAVEGNREGWRGKVPRIRWRAHVCIWAAKQALHIPGDFVECGVHTGLMSMAVCDYLDFAAQDRKFWLFDTFEGIPMDALTGREREAADFYNQRVYFDVFELATRNFSQFANVELVRGTLPGTLEAVPPGPIAYLSVDLNSATYERQVIEALWDRLSPGAVVVIDDYAFRGHEAQYEMWNEFAAGQDRMVMTHPTGQGILIR